MTSAANVRQRGDEPNESAREPWAQLGRYVRDAQGRIVLRGKNPADIRRAVACVNALAGVPTEAIECWRIQVAGGAGVGTDSALDAIPEDVVAAIQEFIGADDRRLGERRRADRRRAAHGNCKEGS